jgi:hypothetical protein
VRTSQRTVLRPTVLTVCTPPRASWEQQVMGRESKIYHRAYNVIHVSLLESIIHLLRSLQKSAWHRVTSLCCLILVRCDMIVPACSTSVSLQDSSQILLNCLTWKSDICSNQKQLAELNVGSCSSDNLFQSELNTPAHLLVRNEWKTKADEWKIKADERKIKADE